MKRFRWKKHLTKNYMFKLLIFTLLLAPLFLKAQAGFAPCKDEVTFRKHYADASKKLNTLKCNFVQEKSISMLKNKLVSYGEFSFKKNAMLRMEFKQPYAYLFILNGENVYILDNQKKTQVSTGSNKLFKKISQITVGSVNGEILSGGDFKSRIFESESQYLLELTPTNKEIKGFFTQFHIFIGKSDNLVDKIEMSETSGDKTVLTFKEKQINTPLSDALFSLK